MTEGGHSFSPVFVVFGCTWAAARLAEVRCVISVRH